MELGYTRKIYLKCLKRTIDCKSQLFKVTNKGKPPRLFSLVYNLPKTTLNFCPSKFRGKKYVQTKGFFNHQNYIAKRKGKQRGFFDHRSYIEKSTWKQRGLFNQQNYVEKVRGNDVDFSINKITSKKYMEMT